VASAASAAGDFTTGCQRAGGLHCPLSESPATPRKTSMLGRLLDKNASWQLDTMN